MSASCLAQSSTVSSRSTTWRMLARRRSKSSRALRPASWYSASRSASHAPPRRRVGGGTRGGVPGGGPERPGGLRAAAREHPPGRRPRADGRRLGEAARAHPRAAGDGGGRGDSPDSLVARAVAAVSATRRFRRSLSSRLSSSRALRVNGRPEGRCDVCGPPDKPHRRHQGPATDRTLEPIVDRDRPCAETPVDGRRVSLFARSFICALTRH